MTRVHTTWRWAFLAGFACAPLHAQGLQLYPELDANLKLSSLVRVNLEAYGIREAGDPVQFQIGPTVQFYLKPLVKLKDVTAFDLNDAKSRFLVVEAGYRYITAPDTPTEKRVIVAVISNFPLKGGFLISDRNRADLDWKDGKFTWRYRNKFTVERTISLFSYHFIPYVASEPYYLSQYSKWSTTALYAGSLFPVGKHVQFDLYYEHQNNTGKRPNKPDNGIGFATHLYFSTKQ
jgi:hypothetical protein